MSIAPYTNQRFQVSDGSSVYNLKQNFNKLLESLSKLDQKNLILNGYFNFINPGPSGSPINSLVNWTQSNVSTISYSEIDKTMSANFLSNGYILQNITDLEPNESYTVILLSNAPVSGIKLVVEAASANQVYNIQDNLELNSCSVVMDVNTEIQKTIIQFKTNATQVQGNIWIKILNTNPNSQIITFKKLLIYKGLIELEGLPFDGANLNFLSDVNFNYDTNKWELSQLQQNPSPFVTETTLSETLTEVFSAPASATLEINSGLTVNGSVNLKDNLTIDGKTMLSTTSDSSNALLVLNDTQTFTARNPLVTGKGFKIHNAIVGGSTNTQINHIGTLVDSTANTNSLTVDSEVNGSSASQGGTNSIAATNYLTGNFTSSANHVGVNANTQIYNGTINSAAIGVLGQAIYNASATGTNTAANMLGIAAGAYNQKSGATVASQEGFRSTAGQSSAVSGANITNLYGVRTLMQPYAATITSAHGYGLETNGTQTGTINTFFQIRLNTPELVATNKYGIFQDDTNAPNYLGSILRVGSGVAGINPPACTLVAAGGVQATSSVYSVLQLNNTAAPSGRKYFRLGLSDAGSLVLGKLDDAYTTETAIIRFDALDHFSIIPGGYTGLVVPCINSATNYHQFNSSAGGTPVYYAQGSASDVSLGLSSKGTGNISFFTNNSTTAQFQVANVASAVNRLVVTGAATAGLPQLYAAGTDTNIGFGLSSKGTYGFAFRTGGGQQFGIGNTASAVNYLTIYGGATGVGNNLSAVGADTNIQNYINAKGSYPTSFTGAGGAEQFRVATVASAVNFMQVQGGTTGYGPTLAAIGNDANISSAFYSKGNGNLAFFTAAMAQFAVNYVASAVNYMQVQGAVASGYTTQSNAGTSTDIGHAYITKGQGSHSFFTGGGQQFAVGNVASSVNYLAVWGNSTGNHPTITAGGADTNIDIRLVPKGTGNVKGTMLSLACERSNLPAIGNTFAFGNGNLAGLGAVMPFAGKLVAVGISGMGVDGTLTADAYIDGVANTSYQISLTGSATNVKNYTTYSTPLSFAAGTSINWQVSAVPTAGTGFIITFFVVFN